MSRSLPQRGVAFLRSLLVRAAGASFRFPVAAVAIVCIGVLANWMVRRDVFLDAENRLLLALMAGTAASVALTLFAESRGAGQGLAWAAGAVGFAAAVLPAAFVQPLWLYAPSILLASVSVVPLVPFIGRGTSRAFFDFALWTGTGVVLAWISVLVFLLGCSAIVEMVRYLFGIGLGSSAYAHLFATGLGLVGPLFALGRVPHPSELTCDEIASERLNRAVRPLFEWVMAPLVLTAALVIHLYAARILATGDVPTGEIGWIYLLYAGFVVFLRLALEPNLLDARMPARLFLRWWPVLLLLPTALFGYTLQLRIGGEGWTASRYYAALFGIGVVAALALQLWPRSRSDIRYVAAIPTVLLLLSLFGPWGAGAMVERSQTNLILEAYGTNVGGGEAKVRELDWNGRAQIRSRLAALSAVGRTGRLEAELGAFSGDSGADRLASLQAALNETDFSPEREELSSVGFASLDPIDTSGFDRVIANAQMDTVPSGVADPEDSFAWVRDDRMVVRYGGHADEFDLKPVMSGRPVSNYGKPAKFSVDLQSANGRHARLRFRVATFRADGSVLSVNADLILRHGEWIGP